MLELKTERNNTNEKNKTSAARVIVYHDLIHLVLQTISATPAEMPTQDLKINAAWKIW